MRSADNLQLVSRLRLIPLVAVLVLAACDTNESILPIAYHHGYVVSRASLPATSAQAAQLGLDLDGDNVPDNKLGSYLGVLAAQGIGIQDSMTAAIDRGDTILLLDLSIPYGGSFETSTRAGFQAMPGDKATAMPAPCANFDDRECRKHLAGTGHFTVAAGSPERVAIPGAISGGMFTGGPSDLSLELAFASQRVPLDLVGARVRASGLSDTGLDAVIIGGAIPKADLDAKVIPAIHAHLLVKTAAILMADCPGTTPPLCGCKPGASTGRTLLNLLDTMPTDCQVSLAELEAVSMVSSGLVPDVTIDGEPATSFGLEVRAVPGHIDIVY